MWPHQLDLSLEIVLNRVCVCLTGTEWRRFRPSRRDVSSFSDSYMYRHQCQYWTILRVQQFVVITLCMHNATSAIRNDVCCCVCETYTHTHTESSWCSVFVRCSVRTKNQLVCSCVCVQALKNKERQTTTHKSPFVMRYHQLKAEHVSSRLHTRKKFVQPE